MPRSSPADSPVINAPEGVITHPDNQLEPHAFPTPHTALRLAPLSMLRKTLKQHEVADLAGVHLSAVGLMDRSERHIYGLYCADGLKLYQIRMVKNEPCDIPRDMPITISF